MKTSWLKFKQVILAAFILWEKEALAIRCVFSLVCQDIKHEFSNCHNAYKPRSKIYSLNIKICFKAFRIIEITCDYLWHPSFLHLQTGHRFDQIVTDHIVSFHKRPVSIRPVSRPLWISFKPCVIKVVCLSCRIMKCWTNRWSFLSCIFIWNGWGNSTPNRVM